MESKLTANEIRKTFIEFFEKKKGHTFVKSNGTIPLDDPTLLFTNSGMNQFKPIFLGNVDPNHPLVNLKRACNSQKCIRAGGKHNDLEDVGKDVYHHTFFEMLGNWSFGDYFKKEAIDWAWELLTEVLKLPAERLYVTYFRGDEKQGLKADEEARDLWLKYLPAERVLPYGAKENFWEMGPTGPCGPCSEIHFDRIGGRDAAALVNADDPDVLEIWNLVFIQFNREGDSSLRTLPNKHVDTGMGFERLVSVMHNKRSNYDTEIFTRIFEEIQRVTNSKPYGAKVGKEDLDQVDMAFRVIADHIRTLSIAIADGGRPGSNGRDYVLRRILRRAVLYGRQKLKADNGFFTKLVPVVVESLGDFFPELKEKQTEIESIISEEEKRFERTLNNGIELFNKNAKTLTDGKQDSKQLIVFPGEIAAKLWTTYGFPVDLTERMCEEYKPPLKVDLPGFDKYLELEALKNTKSEKGSVYDEVSFTANETDFLQKSNISVTDDSHKYSLLDISSKVVSIWDHKNKKFVQSISSDDGIYAVIFDKTNFYYESGGQIYDLGDFTTVKKEGEKEEVNGIFLVKAVQSYAGYVIHVGDLNNGTLSVGDVATLRVDLEKRKSITSNHTSTHLLNFALKHIVGDEVEQKGSLVDTLKLRFDFSSKKRLTNEQIEKVEKICNEKIKSKWEIYDKVVPLSSALSIHGIRAVFGEKYPDPVRVVSLGIDVDSLLKNPSDLNNSNFSVELCGGTHLKNMEEAKFFYITSDTSPSAGVSRITAITGSLAEESRLFGESLLKRVENAKELEGEKLTNEFKLIQQELLNSTLPLYLRREIEDHHRILSKKLFQERKGGLESSLELAKNLSNECTQKGTKFIVIDLNIGGNKKGLNNACKLFSDTCNTTAACFLTRDDKTVFINCCVPQSLSSKLNAGKWAQEIALLLGGKGGGRPNFAAANGDKVDSFDEALKLAEKYASELLN
eukprot:TRINITY_DN264_c0_g1_i1.p1 TRINITY_DN264_c0_g1~~TRINITY_DN264_c0_g1_i1.p1  ORF type:complete len:962 (+),score=358.84 TRINITY_DN264_c0_g1_i1:85-2970(+)